ncbi:lipopolysaccharide export system protein LptA [Roseomonas rosea]|uniref:Lipopolysaccharide export system protein LptA n=1 Tax=Muricoccus roseus TaxID=198092 RepID=A0A1M6EEE9_9PROT|nr:LptA/OstA family protein [Roseomonas rosea]SHI83690.1 lipopolysaccharide export system protein LptA [Roseomonas rosea]
MTMTRLALAAALLLPGAALAQPIDLSGGGPVEVTATEGIEWRQNEQVVVARGNAHAVRDGVTIDAARLIARYRPRAGANGQAAAAQPGGESPMSGGEIWRLEAEGNVRISTETDKAQGDRAVYDMDQAVMVLTGRDLRLATPNDTITARDSLEYWSQRRMAVARGAAKVVTSDNRQITADTLVGYFLEQAPAVQPAAARPAAPSGPAIRTPGAAPGGAQGATAARRVPGEGSKLDRVEVFGNVEIRTEAEVVRGDRAVYSPVSGMARVLGGVRITRGQNQLQGQEAIVNLRTGVSRLVSAPGQRVQGMVLPSSGGENAPAQGGAQGGGRPAQGQGQGQGPGQGQGQGRTR